MFVVKPLQIILILTCMGNWRLRWKPKEYTNYLCMFLSMTMKTRLPPHYRLLILVGLMSHWPMTNLLITINYLMLHQKFLLFRRDIYVYFWLMIFVTITFRSHVSFDGKYILSSLFLLRESYRPLTVYVDIFRSPQFTMEIPSLMSYRR